MNTTLSLLAAAATGAAEGPPAWLQFVPLIGGVIIIWFLFLRPQMAQQKAQAAKISAIKKGDQVLTGGGFIGKVLKVDDTYAEIELAPGMKVKALKSTITDIIPPGGAVAAND